ncbi:MAG TPA: hypothetical protein PLL01_01270 [Rhodoferax sp.]|jgi:hypothetical protein|nr:hypothetical protein [Rhodoferax sp.]HPW27996.1 hypothetical protein [Rhodoferax sp.]
MNPSLTNTSPDNIAAKIRAAYPRADAMGLDLQGMADLAELSIEEVHAEIKRPGALAELSAAKVRAGANGSLLEVKAMMAADKGLDRILAQIDTLDAFEVTEVLKMPMRVLEAADRRRAAEREDVDKLPTFNITIDLSSTAPSIAYEVIAPRRDVQDVDAKLIDDGEGSSWV